MYQVEDVFMAHTKNGRTPAYQHQQPTAQSTSPYDFSLFNFLDDKVLRRLLW